MSERKETPDILGSVLGGPATPSRTPDIMPDPNRKKGPTRSRKSPSAGKAKAPAPTSTRGKKSPSKKTSPRAEPVTWAYREVMFYDFGGYVVRYVDGREVPRWKRRRVAMSEYLDTLGKEGWELVSLIPAKRYHLLAVFKRPRGE